MGSLLSDIPARSRVMALTTPVTSQAFLPRHTSLAGTASPCMLRCTVRTSLPHQHTDCAASQWCSPLGCSALFSFWDASKNQAEVFISIFLLLLNQVLNKIQLSVLPWAVGCCAGAFCSWKHRPPCCCLLKPQPPSAPTSQAEFWGSLGTKDALGSSLNNVIES